MVVRSPSGRCQIAGAVSSWDVRSVTFKGFDSNVSSVVAELNNLYGKCQCLTLVLNKTCDLTLKCLGPRNHSAGHVVVLPMIYQ